MRWEDLFADLEAQLDSAQEVELAEEVLDLARSEEASVPLAARLRGRRGHPLVVGISNGDVQRGRVLEVGAAWLVLAQGNQRALIPFPAVAWVEGLAGVDATEVGYAASRLDLGHALRAIADDERAVSVVTWGREVAGQIERVGADFVDVALSPGSGLLSVPFGAILAVVG